MMLHTIEQVREELYKVACFHQMNLVADELVKMSRSLDWLLIQVQRDNLNSWKRNHRKLAMDMKENTI